MWLWLIYLAITHEDVNTPGKQRGKSLKAIPVFLDWKLHCELVLRKSSSRITNAYK